MLKLFSQTGWRFFGVALLTLCLDQYTKGLVGWATLNSYQAVRLTSFFNLTHVYNLWVLAFSFLQWCGWLANVGFNRRAFCCDHVVVWLNNYHASQVILPTAAFWSEIGGALVIAYWSFGFGPRNWFLVYYYPRMGLASYLMCPDPALILPQVHVFVIVDMFKY